MKRAPQYLVILIAALTLSACGEPAPGKFTGNLDINCQPHDPIDKIRANTSAAKFWREAEYDLGSLLKRNRSNIEQLETMLNTARGQKGEYLAKAEQAARDLGLSGSARRDHIKDNMDKYDAEVKGMQDNLALQKEQIEWGQKCLNRTSNNLRRLGLKPVEFDATRLPR